ncbi:hypothetical protein LNQ03_32280 [Klebsiella pneumoniae subsp. pneumoniae]|nr:hypothetical protein [Klebsiella pneumoniae subsp. pneumoniae]
MRDAQQGQWIVDPEFIPPLLSLAASLLRFGQRAGRAVTSHLQADADA